MEPERARDREKEGSFMHAPVSPEPTSSESWPAIGDVKSPAGPAPAPRFACALRRPSWALAALAVGMLWSESRSSAARGVEDCQLAWGQAVRSYLTQNRTKGPEDAAFKPACELESKGDKSGARIEAVLI